MRLAKKKSNFMHGFKSAILEKLKNCQNGTLVWILWISLEPKIFFGIMFFSLNEF